MKNVHVYALSLVAVLCTSCRGQDMRDISNENIKSENKEVITSYGSKAITRNIIQEASAGPLLHISSLTRI